MSTTTTMSIAATLRSVTSHPKPGPKQYRDAIAGGVPEREAHYLAVKGGVRTATEMIRLHRVRLTSWDAAEYLWQSVRTAERMLDLWLVGITPRRMRDLAELLEAGAVGTEWVQDPALLWWSGAWRTGDDLLSQLLGAEITDPADIELIADVVGDAEGWFDLVEAAGLDVTLVGPDDVDRILAGGAAGSEAVR